VKIGFHAGSIFLCELQFDWKRKPCTKLARFNTIFQGKENDSEIGTTNHRQTTKCAYSKVSVLVVSILGMLSESLGYRMKALKID
jgi:hypothetical protein